MSLSNAALIIIDVQEAFDDEAYWGGNRNNRNLEKNLSLLLDAWRTHGLPLFHIRHDSVNPGSPLHPAHKGNAIKKEVAPLPGETVFNKTVNSAFIGTGLESELRRHKIGTVVITGIQTDHCVSTTARMAANLGFKTFVVNDATATFDRKDLNGNIISSDIIHSVNLASLKDEFATIINSDEVLANINAEVINV